MRPRSRLTGAVVFGVVRSTASKSLLMSQAFYILVWSREECCKGATDPEGSFEAQHISSRVIETVPACVAKEAASPRGPDSAANTQDDVSRRSSLGLRPAV
ncbi:hypothetical protein C0Q70_01484 [Pomacea canaliculata]|uniref:Uncharacterized protein n=1 Tax=Pomacea canaliculata TaxID=400727 RepID=A0A2T7PZM1_POMCA|nr:hypothetical protein C0Q70_01484 [Pomacea canaliculata]